MSEKTSQSLRELLAFRKASGVGEAGWGRTLVAAVISFIYFFPVLWIILTSFKTLNDALAVPAQFIFTPTFENFALVFNRAYSVGGQAQDTGFSLYFFNSLFIAGTSVLLALIIGTLAAFGFSRYPLQLISLLVVLISGLAFLVAIVYFGLKLGGIKFPVGNPTIVSAVAFSSGIQLLSLGVIGEYVGRIYDESRHRPKYIVDSRYGWDD